MVTSASESGRAAARPARSSTMTSSASGIAAIRAATSARATGVHRTMRWATAQLPLRRRSVGDHVDLDDAAARQACHPDRGAGGQPVGREIFEIEPVERRIVAVELGEEDAHADDVLQPGPGPAEGTLQIVEDLVRLRLDPMRDRP